MSYLAGLFGFGQEAGNDMWSLPSSSDSLTALQGQMTFARMASTVMAGGVRAFAGFQAAGDMEETMDRERVASEERAKDIRNETLSVMGAQAVGFAASGVDMSSGSAAQVAAQTYRRGNRALSIEADNAALRMRRAGAQAAAYRGGAINGLLSAGLSAYGQYSQYQMAVARRG
jgi:hypothetical protein